MPKFGKKKKDADDGGMMTSDFDFPSEDEESSEEEGVPGLEILDEDGQEALEEPKRYMAAKKLKLRIRSELDSEEVGQLAKGDVILATHTKMQGDRVRVRCERGSPLLGKGTPSGWVSVLEGSGSVALIAEDCPNKVFKVVAENATVRGGPARTDQKAKETLNKNMSFECLEVKEEPVPGQVTKHKALQFKVGGSTALEGAYPCTLGCMASCFFPVPALCWTHAFNAHVEIYPE
jgi:hypothetical protein